MTLLDPCDPPIRVQSSVLIDQEYTISDANKAPYTHAPYIVEPDYCVLEYSYETTALVDGSGNAAQVISYVEGTKTFSFFYDKDLAPMDQPKLVVSLTAVSVSIYGNQNTAKFAVNDFDVVLKNPCEDSSFVTIQETEQTNPAADEYSGTDIKFTYQPYTVTPAICPLTITCVGVDGPTDKLPC